MKALVILLKGPFGSFLITKLISNLFKCSHDTLETLLYKHIKFIQH